MFTVLLGGLASVRPWWWASVATSWQELMQIQRPGPAARVVSRLWRGHRVGLGKTRVAVSVRCLWGEGW